MFQPLLLFKLTGIQDFNRDLSVLFDLMNKKDITLDTKIIKFLNDIIDYSKKYNDQALLKNGQSWLSTILLAQDNFNPFTLEEIKLYRSKMRAGVYYKTLNEIAHYFSMKEDEIDYTLNKARELITQMVLAGFQLNVLIPDDIKASYTRDQLSNIWRRLKTPEQILIFQYNILLLVGDHDALLLLEVGMKMLWED
ncbi:MAG: hypothetical protein IPM42_14715 [Saprospiraceae bacterium]|nr:hypothetical protein [Saprospiraceae bacterium]